LDVGSGGGQPLSQTLASVSLGLGPITFPGYLDREQVATRVSPSRFELSENDRWAERLSENFTRVLSQNLSALLGTEKISLYPWISTEKVDYQLEIEVLKFEANPRQEAQLTARWSIRRVVGRSLLATKESRISKTSKSGSTDASVEALSQALGDLSREISDGIRTLAGQGK
jgi:hypothetical protein